MRILDLYRDYHIPHVTEDHKHVRDGWVNTECPFCTGNPGYHLGYNLDENYFSCWRCGGHSIVKVIARLLSVSRDRANEIILKYGGAGRRTTEVKVHINSRPFKFPTGDLTITDSHIRYLLKRKFDPEKIVKEWGLMGTGPMAKLDGINYSRRVLAPITWNKKVVSFQARDITDKHPLKYMACPQDREIVPHQTILYGNEKKWTERGICVEGITDVWRLGPTAFAVFGISYTSSQVRAIARIFKEVYILFDPEPFAQLKARQLAAELEFKGVRTMVGQTQVDPGDLSQDDADHLVFEIQKDRWYSH